MTELKPGDVVNVSLKGVRFAGASAVTSHRGPAILDEHGHEYLMPPQAAFEHVAPSAWPPLPGDVWKTETGGRWFAVLSDDGLLMVPSRMGLDPWAEYRKSPDDLLRECAPLTLVDRSPEEPPF